jgi:UDP-glucose 4-epimerase
VERFVFTSSIAVYGHGSDAAFRESDVPQPADPYGIAKLAVEQDLRAAYDMFGLRYTIFRPHNVYGERQNAGDRYRNVIAIFMRQAIEGTPMTIFGDGTQTRGFTYVGDVARDIAQSCDLEFTINKTYNIGTNEVVTVSDLARRVNSVMGGRQPVRHLPARNEVKNAISDHSLFFKDFGDRSMTTLDTGLQRMAQWIQEHGAKKSARFREIEILRNLPAVWLED